MVRHLGRTVLLTALATLALTASACGKPGATGGTASAGSSGPIKVAVIDAQSGQLSSLGAWEYKGVKLAVDAANKAGGIGGRQLALTLYDDQGDPTIGTNLARKAAADGAVGVLGSASSAVSLAMADVLAQAKVPSITSGQSPKLATLTGGFLFLNGPTSTTYDDTLADYLVTTKGLRSIAMITNNGAYGKGEHDAFKAALTRLGVTALADQVVTPDQKDFSAALTTIRQAAPKVLFIGAEEVESGLIVKQARDLGLTATVAGGAPIGSPVFVQTAGVANVEGAITSTPYPSNDFSAAAKTFAAAYQAAYGQPAELHGAKAYDGARIMIQALRATGGAGGQKLADAIRAVRLDGLLGSFAFNGSGVGVHQTRIGILTGGAVAVVSS
jgi:branched-chain amino acid transport system substrate-binding protein